MNTKLRKVEIYDNYSKTKKVVNTGIFHQWGTFYDTFEAENGVANYTTAIVELEDGSIETPEAGLVRFI